MTTPDRYAQYPHVVIVGGGFGGLYAAKALGNKPVRVTLIDKRNFHLFQPLLYQVATGSLSPSDIAAPLRSIVSQYKNISVLLDEVVDIEPDKREIALKQEAETLKYDKLVLATGSMSHFFGNDHWGEHAVELKTLENALDMRRKVLNAFEEAEREHDLARRDSLLNFVIIGGGPTGVELAGAVAELAHQTLKQDFRHIDSCSAKITLLEAGPRILSTYPQELSDWTTKKLSDLGVHVRPATMVTDIKEGCVTICKAGSKPGERDQSTEECIYTETVLWGAGVKASPLGKLVGDKTGAEVDRGGRVAVEPDLTVKNYDSIFVVGDLANYMHTPDKRPLPGVAPVAMQMGSYTAKRILASLSGLTCAGFKYTDKGSLAVVSFNQAVAAIGNLRLTGLPAWLIWAFIHVFFLIEFDSKVIVLFQWLWALLTRQRTARLITGSNE